MAALYYRYRTDVPQPARLAGSAGKYLSCAFQNLIHRKNALSYDDFVKKHLTQTRLYRTLEELKEDPPEEDVYIAGSDQIWNPKVLGRDLDRAYFLDFGPDTVRKIAYAASTGEAPDETERKAIIKNCSSLSAISLREDCEGLTEYANGKSHVCLDPTLLLRAEDYREIRISFLHKKCRNCGHGFLPRGCFFYSLS